MRRPQEGLWDDGQPRRRLGGLARFLAAELAPVAAFACLTDAGGTGVVFLLSPGAVSFEANAPARALYPRLGPLAPLAEAPLEFFAVFTVCAFFALGLWAVWPFEAASWRWPVLAVAAFPFFGVATWLVGRWAVALFPGTVAFLLFAALFSGVRDMPPRSGWA